MPTQTQNMTAEEFFLHGPDEPCELIDGEVQVMPPTQWKHGRIVNKIAYLLTQHVLAARLGVVATESGFLIKRKPDTVLAPDVSFVRMDRVPSELGRGYPPFAPDLAVEVVSPSQNAQEMEDKAGLWLEAGAAMVWVVWPNTKTVSVYRPDEAVRHVHEGDRIEGGDVVAGFTCEVRELFE